MWKLWPFFRFVIQSLSRTKVEGGAGIISAEPCRARNKPLPYIEIETSTNHHKSFTSPNPDIKATVYSSDRVPVGQVTFAVSPLFDRLYIFNLTIYDAYRHQGFGLAVMAYLATTYRLPITTIEEVFSASGFWRAARLTGGPIETLSISEMDAERDRWAHLKPLMDQLETLISDRLFSKRESWEAAVGRGLPDWPSSAPYGHQAGRQP
jgi:hypothetical protein